MLNFALDLIISNLILVLSILTDYPSTQPKPTVTFRSSELVGIVWQKLPLNKYQRPVTSYVLVYNNDTYSKTIIISAHSLVITGLRIYSRYKITMKAVSIIGDGKWSQPMNFITESTSKYTTAFEIIE